jgi:glycosyltransferase involved in cell wall biosynthesis
MDQRRSPLAKPRPSPTVSVVVPTRARPELVRRAVQSALGQTCQCLEVIVVLDQPDEETARSLGRIDDPRLRVERLPAPVTPGGARNAGVARAGGRWVAFLDDDDEWLPRKIELQLEATERSTHRYPIVSCRFIARTGTTDFVWPRRTPSPGEHVSEYLYCRHSVYWGEGTVPASTVLTSRELLTRVPYDEVMERQEDDEWLLRACLEEGVALEFLATAEPQIVRHIDDRTDRIGNRPDWRHNLRWIRENPRLVTGRAYSSFLLTGTSLATARSGDWRAFVPLFRESWRFGIPRAFDLALFLAVWLIPNRWQRRWAARRERKPR